MRPTFGHLQGPAAIGLGADAPGLTAAAPPKEIPYDHVATFSLLGLRGNRVQDVINVSIDGAFVAVAIGYSFIPPVLELPAPPPPNKSTDPLTPTEAVANWLLTIFEDEPTAPGALAQSLARRCGIEFKYSVVDSGSGRELQNKPIHSIAGLGEPTGQRPFRPLAKPMLFVPRSTIRVEVEEISEGFFYVGAQLFIVLHGYKILGQGTGLP